jgi:UDP-N-acetylmuramate dehydrogenase
LATAPTFILGGGSNVVLTGDVDPVVLKVEVMGRSVLAPTSHLSLALQAGTMLWASTSTRPQEGGRAALRARAKLFVCGPT